MFEENVLFDELIDLPGGFQVQLMVLKDYPGGRRKRGIKMDVFRSRLWIGHVAEPDPLAHRSQEHVDAALAMDACYSMLLSSARYVIEDAEALAAIIDYVDHHSTGRTKAAT